MGWWVVLAVLAHVGTAAEPPSPAPADRTVYLFSFFRDNGQDGLFLIVKDETLKPVRKDLRIATGSSGEGPFGEAAPPFTTNWVEGPSAIQIGADVVVYFDHYTNPQYYGAVRSRDLVQWEDISKRVTLPKGARHGTVLAVPAKRLEALLPPGP